MPGKKTSIYLSEELDAAVKASGVPVPELIRRGLQADSGDERLARVLRSVLAEFFADREPEPASCPHRLLPGTFCKTCGRTKT